jgi:hypothetical protein
MRVTLYLADKVKTSVRKNKKEEKRRRKRKKKN